MKVAVPPMTLADLDRLPRDGNRYELIDGELYVSAAPRDEHQSAVVALVEIIAPHVREHRLGKLFTAPYDVYLEPGRQTCVQPDLVFISRERMHIRQPAGAFGAPDLVIEVTSKSTYDADQFHKRELYRRAGVAEFWIVDPDKKTLVVHQFAVAAAPRTLAMGESASTPLLPGLEIPLTFIFSD